MASSSLSNFHSSEGTTTTTLTIEFPWKPRKLVITNDSASYNLQYKFNTSETYGTLKPTETLSIYFVTRQLTIYSPSGNSVAYRVWAFG